MSLVPSSAAGHGITASQNVARDVAGRIDALRASVRRSRIGMYISLMPLAATVALALTDAWAIGIATGYLAWLVMPVGIIVHLYRRRALKPAEALDRDRDIAWVSRKDGLIYFADEGLYVEKRGGFKPYGVQQRRYTHVEVVDATLRLHGMDRLSGATYSIEVTVPDGWDEHDTRRVQEKVGNFEAV